MRVVTRSDIRGKRIKSYKKEPPKFTQPLIAKQKGRAK